jgi:hypothetical protein
MIPDAIRAQTGPVIVNTHTAAGDAVPGAKVTLEAPGSGSKTAETGETGQARINGVQPGHYQLTIAASGFDDLSTNLEVVPSGDNIIEAILSAIHTESITVQGVIDTPLEQANTTVTLERQQVRNMPDRPRTVTDALPLSPGIVRLPTGELRLSGSGEHRSALLVNSGNATDPATGQFGATVPIDSVRSMSVLSSPFLAEFGGFTSDVVAVETRKGGDKWSFELNDPLPEFRWRSWHMVGLRSSTPRVNFGGPILRNRLYVLESVQYEMRENPVITLPFPNNEFRREALNSLTAIDWTINGSNVLTTTAHVADDHTRYANLDFFNPQPVSPNTKDSTYAADLTEHLSFRGTLLDSSFSAASYRTSVWPQGVLDMTLAPQGNSGNYFSQQTRTSSRVEWRETWSLTRNLLGTHNIKVGALLGDTEEHAQIVEHPVRIVDTGGALLETIDFTAGHPIARSDRESDFFIQDQWTMGAHFALNLGARFEQQEVTGTFRLGPRVGFVLTPFGGGKTIIRAGAGVFYDRVPLNVYGFNLYPDQIITLYAPDGSIISGPTRYYNLTESAAPRHLPLIYRSDVPGNFAPYSINWNVQLEQIFSQRFRMRADYLQSRSEGLITIQPQVTTDTSAYVLNGDGAAILKQLQFTSAATLFHETQIFASYVYSRSQGNLNEFNTYLANFPPAVILPDAQTNLPGDAPNRVLAWGTIALPRKFRIMPKVEYHTGFPYSRYNELQQYVGAPNQQRLPPFFSLDARITKDIKVTDKYSFRFGVSGSNLTDHFNPISVHANSADPAYGIFFGQYRRRYTADFDVLF